MTAWTPGRLPISVAPLPGEALESWIGAYAHRLHTTTSGFLEAIGLAGARSHRMALRLTEHEMATLQRATGVLPPTLTAMTLAPYDGLAVTILPGQRRLAGRPPTWRFSGSRNRYCPHCLAEQGGRGPVFWRLPWSFACPTHRCLLLDFCPTCNQSPNNWAVRRLGPRDTSTCTRDTVAHSRKRIPCGARLDQALTVALPAEGPVLAAQRHVNPLLSEAPSARPASLARLKEIYALAWRIVRGLHTVLDTAPKAVHAVLNECGGILPELTAADVGHDAHNAAIGTALAKIALDPSHMECESLFAWTMEADHSLLKKKKTNIGTTAGRWASGGPELVERVLTELDPHATLHARLRYSSATPRPCRPELTREAIHRRAGMMPAMLWPGWTMRLLPLAQSTAKPRPEAFRRGCSTFLLLPGGPSTLNFERAGPLLGNNQIDRDRNSIEQRLYRGLDVTPLASALAQLARALDEHSSPINYARRRTLFTIDSVRVDRDAYNQFCTEQGWPAGHHHRLRILHWYLLKLLTGEHHPPPPDAAKRFTWNCNEFRFRAPAAFRTFLRQQAQALLDQHAIPEPLTWEPPSTWVRELSWPGVDPDSLSADTVRSALDNAATVHDAARSLKITAEHVRLYSDITGLSSTPNEVIGKNPARNPVTRMQTLAPEKLRDLYINQRMSLSAIASLTHSSFVKVRALVEQNGITLRVPPRPDITREWLEHEYFVKRRDMTSIARERGITLARILALARTWDIQIRPGGSHHNAIAHLDLPHPPSPAMQAITMSPRALARLRLITQIPGYTSLAAAARDIYNGRESALRQRVQGIEESVGFQIIDRSSPLLTPTKRGREFLREATLILRIADKAIIET